MPALSVRDQMLREAEKGSRRLAEFQDDVAAKVAARADASFISTMGRDGKPITRALEQYELDALAAAVRPEPPLAEGKV